LRVIVAGLLKVHQFMHFLQEKSCIEGLGKGIMSAQDFCDLKIILTEHSSTTGDGDDLDLRIHFLQLVDGSDTILVRHDDIRNNHIRDIIIKDLQGFQSGPRFQYPEILSLQ